jgi:hypothetical protein
MLWDSRKKSHEQAITREEGMQSDGKMHLRNSFLTDFSMSSPLSTPTFPINFAILQSLFSSLKERLFIHGTHSFSTNFHTYLSLKNAVLWDIKSQFVPHRKHITSPLQSSAG